MKTLFFMELPVYIILLLLTAGCSENPYKKIGTTYQQDIQRCGASLLYTQAMEESAATLDTKYYLTCMEKRGYHQDAQTDPLLKAVEKCRKKANSPGVDRLKTFDTCLTERGFSPTALP